MSDEAGAVVLLIVMAVGYIIGSIAANIVDRVMRNRDKED